MKNDIILWCWRLVVLVSIIGMIVLNFWTPYICDDYAYMLSFADNQKITNFFGIFSSIYAHAFTMNGRLVPHFLVQLFLLMPVAVFKVINGCMIPILLLMIIRNSSIENKIYKIFLYLGLFAAYWLYIPAFGQVNLWLDGSVNYLWGLVLAMVFLYPFFSYVKTGEIVIAKKWRIPFVILCLFFGDFSEGNTSAAIGGAFLCILYARVFLHKKKSAFLYSSFVATCLGYLVIYLCPAEHMNKAGEKTLSSFGNKFVECSTVMWQQAKWLMIVWILCIAIAIVYHCSKEKIVLSIIAALMALAANYIYVVAAEYPQRSMCGMVIFWLLADVMILSAIIDTKYNVLIFILSVELMILVLQPFVSGVKDIHHLYNQSVERQNRVDEQLADNVDTIILPAYVTTTKYPAANGLYDIQPDKTTWPNWQMAVYYGVDYVKLEQ